MIPEFSCYDDKENLVTNNDPKIFLKKWGMSISFFKKHYLRSMQVFKEHCRKFK